MLFFLQGTGRTCTPTLPTQELTGWDKKCLSANSSSPTTRAAPIMWHRYCPIPVLCLLPFVFPLILPSVHVCICVNVCILPSHFLWDSLFSIKYRQKCIKKEPHTRYQIVIFPCPALYLLCRWSCSSRSISTSLVFTSWRSRRTARRIPSFQPKLRPSSSRRLSSSLSLLIRMQTWVTSISGS